MWGIVSYRRVRIAIVLDLGALRFQTDGSGWEFAVFFGLWMTCGVLFPLIPKSLDSGRFKY